jgi:hypothetical protein
VVAFEPGRHQVTEGQIVQEGVTREIEDGQLSPEEVRRAAKVLRFIE